MQPGLAFFLFFSISIRWYCTSMLPQSPIFPTNKYTNGAVLSGCGNQRTPSCRLCRGASCSGVMILSGIHSVAFSFTSSWTIFSLSCTAAVFYP